MTKDQLENRTIIFMNHLNSNNNFYEFTYSKDLTLPKVGDRVKFDFYENGNLKHISGRIQKIEHNILCTGLVMTNSIKIIVND